MTLRAFGDRAGDTGRAGHVAGGGVVGEVVDGEPALDGGLSGHGLISGVHRFGPGRRACRRCRRPSRPAPRWSQLSSPLPAIVGSVVTRRGADGGVGVVRPVGLGQPHDGGQPGVGFDHQVGLEPVLAAFAGLVGVPGVGVDGRDHPVRCGLPGDPPPAVGAIGALGRFDVLAGDQRQQRDRLGRLPAAPGDRLDVERGQQRERVVDQRGDQLLAGGRGRPRRSAASRAGRSPGRSTRPAGCSARRSGPARRGPRGRPGGSRRSAGSRCPGGRPRHRGSWSPAPDAASRPPHRSRSITSRTTSKIRCGRSLAASRRRQ